MNDLKLILPEKKHYRLVQDLLEDFKINQSEFAGTGSLEEYESYDDWLEYRNLYLDKKTVPEGRVMSTVYFLSNDDETRIYGSIDIRHQLNDYLLNYGGHIGYAIRPSERKKGCATKILNLGLEKCCELEIEKVLVVCNKKNIASAKTIKNNFGILENEILDSESKTVQRYWIDVKKALKKSGGKVK